MPKSPSSKKSKAAKRPSSPFVTITFEVDPIVEVKLRALCRQYVLPYPEGIGIVLENACNLVDRKRKGSR